MSIDKKKIIEGFYNKNFDVKLLKKYILEHGTPIIDDVSCSEDGLLNVIYIYIYIYFRLLTKYIKIFC